MSAAHANARIGSAPPAVLDRARRCTGSTGAALEAPEWSGAKAKARAPQADGPASLVVLAQGLAAPVRVGPARPGP